jgi:DNA-binding NarL/FixJ family response regulator
VITIALVSDLLFSTKITGTAKALGGHVQVVRSVHALRARLDAAQGEAAAGRPLVIVDMNVDAADPVEAIRTAREHPLQPQVIAYLSHVQAEHAAAARDAGADQILARSALSEKLPDILTNHLGE